MQTLNSNLPKSTLVLRETMKKFRDKYVMPSLVNTQYSQDFQNKVGYSISVRVPVSYDDYEFTGIWDPKEASQNTVEVKIKNWRARDLLIPDQDLALLPIDIYNVHVAGMVDGITETIEKSIANEFKGVYNYVEDLVGTPNSIADLALIESKADELNIPTGSKFGIISNKDKPLMIGSIPEITHADKRADGGSALRNASIGTMLDVEYIASKYVPKKKAAVANNELTDGTALVGAVAKGATSITLTGFTDGQVVQEGDIIDFADAQGVKVGSVVASADSTLIAASNDVVQIHESWFAIDAGTTVSNLTNVAYNVVMHPSAISFVTVVLPVNQPNVNADYIPDPDTGIGMRLVENGWDHKTKSSSWSLDCMFGANLTRPELMARFDGVRV